MYKAEKIGRMNLLSVNSMAVGFESSADKWLG